KKLRDDLLFGTLENGDRQKGIVLVRALIRLYADLRRFQHEAPPSIRQDEYAAKAANIRQALSIRLKRLTPRQQRTVQKYMHAIEKRYPVTWVERHEPYFVYYVFESLSLQLLALLLMHFIARHEQQLSPQATRHSA